MLRRLPFFALAAISALALAFDLTLSWRLPSDADWAEAAGAVRARVRTGDALQVWPAWAERARLFVDAAPVLTEEDLEHADYVGVSRLWLLSLPRAPRAANPDDALLRRGAVREGDPLRFGALSLQAWDLRAPPLSADLTGSSRQPEEHEVDYVARRCARVGIPSRLQQRGAAGAALHLRAGVIGERAYDAGRPELSVQVFADGAPLGTLVVPRTVRDGTGWRRLDVPVPPGAAEREFVFAVSSSDPGRPVCLQAWTTR